MKYLILKFENASLITSNEDNAKCEPCNLDNPIGVNQLSNALHVMCGLAPVATKRETIFTRNEDIFNLAKGAYIKYNYGCNVDIERKAEMFQVAKYAYNSEAKIKTTIGGKTYNGFYNWPYFTRRFFNDHEGLNKIIGFFNEVVGSKNVIRDFKFDEFVIEFHKHLNEPKVKAFDKENRKYYSGKGGPLGGPFYKVIFELDVPSGTNTVYFQSTPILISHSVEYNKSKLSGRIIVPIENEAIIKQIAECGCNPTILDGGLLTIVGLKNRVITYDLEHKYQKIK
jgi:hypothetical protein